MKSLKEYITEGLLGVMEDTLSVTNDDDAKIAIKDFIDKYYDCKKLTISDKPNKDGKFEVSCDYATVKDGSITNLTNGLFIWKDVKTSFNCSGCKLLKSLEGAPETVGNDFFCSSCKLLKSLEGAPEKVGGGFYCSNCNSLESLEGAPETVGGDFNCSNCNSLQSLEGTPKEVGEDFSCYSCNSLQSLKGAPETVGKDFDCRRCNKTHFSTDDVKKVTDVKKNIYV